MDEAKQRAWKTRRAMYGPRGNRGTYFRGVTTDDAVLQRRRLARLVALIHAWEVLSEGQIANVLGIQRVEVRELEDDGIESLRERPLHGEWGKAAMRKLSASLIG